MSFDATMPPVVPPPDNEFVTSDGARIPYRRRGSGPALLMVHGWSQSGAMFAHQLDALSDRFTVIVPDLRGHGEAPAPAGGLRMARLAADIHELADHLRLDRAHMLGWSMGVSVLWAMIDQFGTSCIDRFVFVDQPSSLIVRRNMDEQEKIDAGALFTFGQMEELCEMLLSPEAEATRAGFVRGMVTRHISAPLLDWILAENAKTPPAVAAALLLSHCTQDWCDLLPRIDRPTLVIGGSVSHVDPRSQRYVHRSIPGARYHEFTAEQGGAHFPFLEAPDAFNLVVARFLSGD